MRRDLTVWLALFIVVVPWVVGRTMDMPRDITPGHPPVFHLFFWLMFLGVVRMMVFWFQTLIHGINHAQAENRVAVVMGHLFLGPIMSYFYYIASRYDEAERARRE